MGKHHRVTADMAAPVPISCFQTVKRGNVMRPICCPRPRTLRFRGEPSRGVAVVRRFCEDANLLNIVAQNTPVVIIAGGFDLLVRAVFAIDAIAAAILGDISIFGGVGGMGGGGVVAGADPQRRYPPEDRSILPRSDHPVDHPCRNRRQRLWQMGQNWHPLAPGS